MSSQASSSTCPPFKNSAHFTRTSAGGGWYCNLCTSALRAKNESMTAASAMQHERYSKLHARRVNEEESRAWRPNGTGWKDDWRLNGDSGWGAPVTNSAWYIDPSVEKLKGFITFWRDGITAEERGEPPGSFEHFFDNLEAAIKQKERELDEELREKRKKPSPKNPWTKNQPAWGADVGRGTWGMKSDRAASNENDGWGDGVQRWEEDHASRAENRWGGDNNVNPWMFDGAQGGWGDPTPAPAEARNEPEQVQGWGQWGQSIPWDATSAPDEDQVMEDNAPDREQFTFVERIARQRAVNAAQKQRMHQFIRMPTEAKVQKIVEMARYLHSLQHNTR
ncbi:hypothetical protein CERSUDRAFT_110700 [Gelatoporia subvermispora B]|uniref:Uncharacterized protein n=1 Tax=Ceriporiopsis subvermispora (strain B) TaxID=914234 RepID=M2PZ18_CERS8|nr:hypothetical protein CERSUDRAFT_110700 [Gelatoporia subvermispora B]